MNQASLRKMMLLVMLTTLDVTAYSSENDSVKSDLEKSEVAPWVGKYCLSFFTKTRTAATVGENKLNVTLKVQHYDWDLVMGSDGNYHDRVSGQEKERLVTTVCAKYGWTKNNQIAIGIPYWSNDFDTSNPNDNQGFSNIYIFEKWRFVQETNRIPAVAIDFWYYFPNGDPDKKLGTDCSSYKITTEVSKAWKNFSLHFNPCYTWSEDKDAEIGEINGGLILNVFNNLLPAVEYNYTGKEQLGHSHDIVPGLMWKFAKASTFSIGLPINIDSTFSERDKVGIVLKLSKKW